MGKSEVAAENRETIVMRLENYSSRAFDAIALRGNAISNDSKVDRPCGASGEMPVLGVNHFWQLEDVDPVHQAQGIARLRNYLDNAGWMSSHDSSPTVVKATNPHDGYVVWAKAIEDLRRLAVQVSSPCYKTSKLSP
ncbi:hypothetical protein [Streptomyces sp. SID3343]|uniref:hypothetical protein n=1 Tax=Streptomyces sp. SID3343 TaxID=2690260 RepID=UPI00136F8720|nr:hypothetical protein [Streptomyces sp. SID3343]MYV96863.1 hypothetical protein [Streptomyces sp. SID3343]